MLIGELERRKREIERWIMKLTYLDGKVCKAESIQKVRR